MLIRWAKESERNAYGFSKKVFGEYDVIVAINRLKYDMPKDESKGEFLWVVKDAGSTK